MFETVEKIKTKDGKLFDTMQEAEEHVIYSITAEMNEWIKHADTCDLKHWDLIAILKAFAGDIPKIQRLKKLLDEFVD